MDELNLLSFTSTSFRRRSFSLRTSFSWVWRSIMVLSLAWRREWGTVDAMLTGGIWWSPNAMASLDTPLVAMFGLLPMAVILTPYGSLPPDRPRVMVLFGVSTPKFSWSLRYMGVPVAYAAFRDWIFSMDKVLLLPPPGTPPELPPLLLVRRWPRRGERGSRGERPGLWLLDSSFPTERELPYMVPRCDRNSKLLKFGGSNGHLFNFRGVFWQCKINSSSWT